MRTEEEIRRQMNGLKTDAHMARRAKNDTLADKMQEKVQILKWVLEEEEFISVTMNEIEEKIFEEVSYYDLQREDGLL